MIKIQDVIKCPKSIPNPKFLKIKCSVKKTRIKLHGLNPKILTIGTQDWIKDTPDRDVSREQESSTSRSITKTPTCTSTKNLVNFVANLWLGRKSSFYKYSMQFIIASNIYMMSFKCTRLKEFYNLSLSLSFTSFNWNF